MTKNKVPFNTKKIYIRFAGDNDWTHTIEPFVKQLTYNVLIGYWGNITKEQIVRLFNEHIYSFYMLYQNHEINDSQHKEKENLDVKAYLEIEVKDVMFDAEVDDWIANGNINHDGVVGHLDFKGDVATFVV